MKNPSRIVVTAAAALAAVTLAVTPAAAKTTALRTTNNLAGVEYISETDTFRLWDNRADDTTVARVVWRKVNSTLTGTLWHRWQSGSNGQSANQSPNTGMKSGDQFTFQVCSLNGSQVVECSGWGTAWY
ncbi:hypothetical protein [Kitasatospora purpeofusca]|uniref:hypothetical protein n=1 Tax=Kitasatospora purpeofusca TaxID=67352 RepID=UPI002A5A24B3|nr:hypothetical protein [Kitasatospora purpeofusca]MDY0810591.1 hypothetical protein [Kitasatospora purpeofusca]